MSFIIQVQPAGSNQPPQYWTKDNSISGDQSAAQQFQKHPDAVKAKNDIMPLLADLLPNGCTVKIVRVK